ncbi:MAG: carboxypeptidase regulatory-like domain-containing protein [Gemmatimonadaceae bacterium]
MCRRLGSAWPGLAALLCVSTSLAAQAGSIAGTATDSGGRAITGATATLAELARSVLSGLRGEFRFSNVPPGTYTLTVQQIAFAPATARVTVATGEMLELDVTLDPRVQMLAETRVTAKETSVKLQGFEQRRAAGIGSFFTRATLDSAAARAVTLSELLRRHVSAAHEVMNQKNGALYVALARGTGTFRLPRADPFDPTSPVGCFSQVIVDGARIYAPAAGATSMPAPDLRNLHLETLSGVEFYSGPATTPMEFGGTAATCGTLVVWTKDR